jgi:hypothetical protein
MAIHAFNYRVQKYWVVKIAWRERAQTAQDFILTAQYT